MRQEAALISWKRFDANDLSGIHVCQFLQILCPSSQRLARFILKSMSLKNADHAAPAACDMAEHGFGDFKADTQSLQSCSNSAANIMNAPIRNASGLIKRFLCFGKA